MNSCLNCETPTTNPKFCGRGCATSYNNKVSPKRTLSGKSKCKACDVPIPVGYHYCDEHRGAHAGRVDWTARTKGDYKKANANQGKWPYARRLSRQAYLASGRPRCCAVCGYDKHFQVCHIRDCSSFPDSATIAEINALDNLVALCPNHHWEFDKMGAHALGIVPPVVGKAKVGVSFS